MTSIPSKLEIRPLSEGDFNAWVRTRQRGFGVHSSANTEELNRHIVEIDRAIAAFDGSEIVGTTAAMSFELTIPGVRRPWLWSTGSQCSQPTGGEASFGR
jgi:hypothetical protein